MKPYWTSHNGDTTLTIYHGDALEVLRQLPDESVHCCITSPPYYGLRDYGVDGQIGLESSPQEYVERLVQVFREVRRVLRADGTLWLNLGDCYAAVGKSGGGDQGKRWAEAGADYVGPRGGKWRPAPVGLKPKDLVGIPWMVAFALRDDGWYLRADIIWAKPNPMPESVTDRPTKSHEYVFLLSKSPRYYYDADAIREPHQTWEHSSRYAREYELAVIRHGGGQPGNVNNKGIHSRPGNPAGRNKRSVWTIATEPFPEAHFATFPQALVEPMILAGTSPKACPKCGAPWRRVVERQFKGDNFGKRPDNPHVSGHLARPPQGARYAGKTVGWSPTCTCPDNDGSGRCVVLDPFVGSGTTLLVAQRLGRSGIGIDLNRDYCDMACRRLEAEHSQVRLPVPV